MKWQTRPKLFTLLLIMAAMAASASCILLEMSDTELVYNSRRIQKNLSTERDVRYWLGSPDYEFPTDRVWIYQKLSPWGNDSYFLSVFPTFREYTYEFSFHENSVLKNIDHFSTQFFANQPGYVKKIHGQNCFPSGACALDGLIYAPHRTTAVAKSFVVPRNACALFLYADGDDFFNRPFFNFSHISLVGYGAYARDGFSFFNLDAGDHNLQYSAHKVSADQVSWGNTYRIECRPGDLIFLRVTAVGKDVSGQWIDTVDQVAEAEGKAEVTSRKLLGNPPNMTAAARQTFLIYRPASGVR